MNISDFLKEEWVPALGCTEPASIALCTAAASEGLEGNIEKVALTVDPKIYKNCYAVGIPASSHKTGILWAAAIGASIRDPSPGLECFGRITPAVMDEAGTLIKEHRAGVTVDTAKKDLYISCKIETSKETGEAIISGYHTNLIRVVKNGKVVLERPAKEKGAITLLREKIAAMPIEELIGISEKITQADGKKLQEGIALNLKIAEHGLSLFPERFVKLASTDALTRMSMLVCAGVYARMWGEDFPVMSLSGSGNKGITASIPIAVHAKVLGKSSADAQRALALACLLTSATTHHLGSLSAVCGCSNAAGIGLSAGLVLLEGGGASEISLAINNMVGNVTGMICDGAKIGCALKTMTAVDAAFRASSLALSGIGIPKTDGIVGETGILSLENLGRIATSGMISTDSEILKIMQEKLRRQSTP
jgi:L-cysteine desulfidase